MNREFKRVTFETATIYKRWIFYLRWTVTALGVAANQVELVNVRREGTEFEVLVTYKKITAKCSC